MAAVTGEDEVSVEWMVVDGAISYLVCLRHLDPVMDERARAHWSPVLTEPRHVFEEVDPGLYEVEVSYQGRRGVPHVVAQTMLAVGMGRAEGSSPWILEP
jgi:hypothetical protein